MAVKRKPKGFMRSYFCEKKAYNVLKDSFFDKGTTVCGFNKGQFSSIDILSAVLSFTGTADVVIGTWSLGKNEAAKVAELVGAKLISDVKWIVDGTMLTLHGDVFKCLLSLFDSKKIKVLKTHAKFFLIKNKDWHVVVETSMNLNKNTRLESFSVTEDRRFYDSYEALVEDVFKIKLDESAQTHSPEKQGYATLMALPEREKERRRE